ncbi:MAG TPA: hypothetical protein VNA89_08515 [Gemmatimonadaceae bacterium]|nr:hypothetical protein [Gemmatimonadaceae bacterium]
MEPHLQPDQRGAPGGHGARACGGGELDRSRAALLRQLRRCGAGSPELLAVPEEHRAAVRANVTDYMTRLRAAHVSPESALVAAKAVLQEWMATVAPPVRETIVRWSIDAYYAAPAPAPPVDGAAPVATTGARRGD